MTRRAQRILDEAAKLFFARGFDSVGVDEIGERSGITGPAIYRHFRGKDEILATLFDEAVDGLLEATSGTFEDPYEELEHRARAHAAHLVDDQRLAGVYVREDRSLARPYRRALGQRTLRYMDAWTDCVQRCFPALDRERATVATWAAIGSLNSVARFPASVLEQPGLPDLLASHVVSGLAAVAGLAGNADRAA
jgi:AcrR family transcriptional regulator